MILNHKNSCKKIYSPFEYKKAARSQSVEIYLQLFKHFFKISSYDVRLTIFILKSFFTLVAGEANFGPGLLHLQLIDVLVWFA